MTHSINFGGGCIGHAVKRNADRTAQAIRTVSMRCNQVDAKPNPDIVRKHACASVPMLTCE